MNDKNEKANEQDTGKYASDLTQFMQSMALIIGNHAANRWLSESDARDAVQACFVYLGPVFGVIDEIMVRHRGDALDAAYVMLMPDQPGIQILMQQMLEHDVKAFSIDKGLSLDELVGLLELLGAQSAQLEKLGGLGAFAEKAGIKNFHIKNIVFREVTDEDVVVKKSAMGSTVAVPEPGVKDSIIAFLRGGAGTGTPPPAPEALQQVHSESDEIADMILAAARDSDADAGDAVSAGRVREILKRAFDFWMQSPAAKTQKGKRAIGKSLKGLESVIIDRLKHAPGFDEGVGVMLEDAFGSMDDELKMDSLAAEYAKKRKAIEKSESRILRYMRNKGREGVVDSELESKLLEGGLEGGDWRDLLVRSGVVGEALQGSESAVGAIRDLSSRLASIEDSLKQRSGGTKKADAGALTKALKNAAVDADVLAENTNRKIQTMMEEYQADAEGDGDESDTGHERKEAYGKLSEIAQELCQPLSVINCSISMITSGRLGDVTPEHTDMLQLAVESSQKLKHIADSLMEITGVPDELEPDAQIQAEIYDTESPVAEKA
jgi:hypothetical protein